MKLFLWMTMILMFFYSVHFTIELWKNKSKVGAVAVGILAVAVLVIPFVSVL